MIVIEKISDGINIKQATDKYIARLLFFKIPVICASLVTFLGFLAVLFGSERNAHESIILSAIGMFVTTYFICLLPFPIFWLLRMAYYNLIGGKLINKKYSAILNAEYSKIKQKIETYQKPIIYADYSLAILQCRTTRLGWSKVMAYPNFIAFNGRDFFMTDNIGRMVKFNWDDVRQWSHGTQTGGMLYGGTPSQGINNEIVNSQQRVKNAEASGFFVTIRDVNQPKWQFETSDQALQNKWMEIFRQVKDGTLKLQA
ncbi:MULTISPECIES: DUF4755 domain-containing protein [Acetobacter]|uniref:DUF4755 domain-containing protein n=1 Tax=Acetobacter TaxID=434 RepID=UPI00376F540C